MLLLVWESYKLPAKGIHPAETWVELAAWAGCAPAVLMVKARISSATAPMCKNLKAGVRNMIISFD
jgi:hypothetical protein